ncbi:RidA family protein [Nocardia sp. CA-120079]|uniref:RidA family protein n=1 Tax=Nocardia sp. CA-120079 TaxID=3239974 RepID=UPI003D958301
MPQRRSVRIPGLWHQTGIPVASRIGPFVFSSVIAGLVPGTRELPEDLEEQATNIFGHVQAMLLAEKGSFDDVVKMDFWLPNPEARDAIEREWARAFPDVDAMPARHSHVAGGDGGAIMSATFVAILE